MKRRVLLAVLTGLILSLVACSPKPTFSVDSAFEAMVDATASPLVLNNHVALSADDQLVLKGLLKSNQWTLSSRSSAPQGVSFFVIGASQAIYTVYANESVPVISVDKNADGNSDAYYDAPALMRVELLAWASDVLSAHSAKKALDNVVLSQAVLDRVDPVVESNRIDLSAAEASSLLDQLQPQTWEHRSSLPTVDLSTVNRLVLVGDGSSALVVTMYLLSSETLVVIQDEEGARLGVFKAPTPLGSGLLSTLQELEDALIPVHELANIIFTHGYIGPMQFIYEPSQQDPNYVFELTPAQQIALLEGLEPTTWVKQTSPEATPLYAEFAVMDASGKTYYFTEITTGTIIVTIVDPLQPSLVLEYRWMTSAFMAINTQLMGYFVPGGPQAELLNAQYVSASFYEGEVADMTSPDITVSLSAAQSKTIKDYIDPFSWKQAIDIPPMGPALGFTLEDEGGKAYTFLFVGEYVLINVRVDELSPIQWWVGSMTGAIEARAFLLTLAP